MSTDQQANEGFILTTPAQIQLYHMLAQKQALRMEIRGIRFKQGSVCAAIKRMYDIKATRKTDVLAAFEAMIDEKFPNK